MVWNINTCSHLKEPKVSIRFAIYNKRHRKLRNRSNICSSSIYFFSYKGRQEEKATLLSSRGRLLTKTHNPVTITNLPNSSAIQVQG